MRTQIIYEDKSLLVCQKPSGLAVQSGRASEPDMVSELKIYLAAQGRQVVTASRAQASVRCGLPSPKGPVYLGVVHRLDQPVSGILVFAKTQQAAAELSRQAADHRMKKTYRAIVMMPEGGSQAAGDREVRGGQAAEGREASGCQTAEGREMSGRQAAEGREMSGCQTAETGDGAGAAQEPVFWPGRTYLTDYIIKEAGGGARIADRQEKGAKRAQLSYRCLERKGSCALLEIDLQTGRHHQIRVQMANTGMPLLGDARYGSVQSRELSQRMGIRSVQLQAAKLCFYHPSTGKLVCYELEDKLEL